MVLLQNGVHFYKHDDETALGRLNVALISVKYGSTENFLVNFRRVSSGS